MPYNKISSEQIDQLISQGCHALNWDKIMVSAGFDPAKIYNCRFSGDIFIGDNVSISNIGSHIANYMIEDNVTISNTGTIECIAQCRFGNGVEIASVNEGGGREVPIFETLTAQTAYIMAMYRHRPETIAKLYGFASQMTKSKESYYGKIEQGAQISGCITIRNVNIGRNAILEGVQSIVDGTILGSDDSPVYVGHGVNARYVIIAAGAKIDNGVIIKNCFVGQACSLRDGFTAENSMFFANCDCACGEACSVFAGPYTVSHHKSSLLIAGMFSFFNAGSGANQSNHLFKTGPVHQGIHERGCKFASNAYVMLPARNGAYTMVLGRHSSHHDTSVFPFSYLIETDGKSYLMPAAALKSYGTVRDIAKWPVRDRRKTDKADLINFEQYNPYIASQIAAAMKVSAELMNKPGIETHSFAGVKIKQSMLRRGEQLYRLAMDAAITGMLTKIDVAKIDINKSTLGTGKWVDMAGMYAPKQVIDSMLDDIDSGVISSMDQVNQKLVEIHNSYSDYAYGWVIDHIKSVENHEITPKDIEAYISKGAAAQKSLEALTNDDAKRDSDKAMNVGYGIDEDFAENINADFNNVRNTN